MYIQVSIPVDETHSLYSRYSEWCRELDINNDDDLWIWVEERFLSTCIVIHMDNTSTTYFIFSEEDVSNELLESPLRVQFMESWSEGFDYEVPEENLQEVMNILARSSIPASLHEEFARKILNECMYLMEEKGKIDRRSIVAGKVQETPEGLVRYVVLAKRPGTDVPPDDPSPFLSYIGTFDAPAPKDVKAPDQRLQLWYAIL